MASIYHSEGAAFGCHPLRVIELGASGVDLITECFLRFKSPEFYPQHCKKLGMVDDCNANTWERGDRGFRRSIRPSSAM